MHPPRAGVALNRPPAALPAALHIVVRIVSGVAVDHGAEPEARTVGVGTMSRAKLRHRTPFPWGSAHMVSGGWPQAASLPEMSVDGVYHEVSRLFRVLFDSSLSAE